MSEAFRIREASRRDSHRYYRTEIKKRIAALQEERSALADLLCDLNAEAFYSTPETKKLLRDAALCLRKTGQTLREAYWKLDPP